MFVNSILEEVQTLKKSLITLGIATLMASSSTALLASSVTIPNTFTSGTPALASEVNGNFTAVETAVNDNDSRITTLETGSGCSSDMVAVGPLCIDKYEASVWDAATGGTQLSPAGPGAGVPNIVCQADGSDCGATAANPIYARSVPGVLPAGHISWFQAAQACANVGKRLPTSAEWRIAASGTPAGDGPECAAAAGVLTPSNTDANPTCISSVGALNMVGNVWEFTAELENATAATGVYTDANFISRAFGDDFSSSGSGTANIGQVLGSDPSTTFGKTGFRCVR